MLLHLEVSRVALFYLPFAGVAHLLMSHQRLIRCDGQDWHRFNVNQQPVLNAWLTRGH
ncbi:hypothetical protein ABXY91_004582 [Vibrio fluvialis]|uniref:hypothetical protein n=1 Tax=Vibrio fluvialis TaxID=676 RepID=UPI0015583B6B|nr:hypothetical protein [Vibrio fluvialis]EKO3495803.1 hypothetical protein [Vibrio fluvialis]